MKKLLAMTMTAMLCGGTAFSAELLRADFSGTPGDGQNVITIPEGDAQLTVHSDVGYDVFTVYGGTAETTNWVYDAGGEALVNADLYTGPNWGAPTRFDLGLALAAPGKTYTVTSVDVVVTSANASDVGIDLWAARDDDSTERVNTPAVVIPAGATGTFTIDTSLMHLIANEFEATWNQAGNGDLRLGVFSANGTNVDSIAIGEVRVNGTVGDYVEPVVNTDTRWDFDTEGDTEGWIQDLNAHISGLTASNGVLTASAITANDPQLVQYGLFGPESNYWDSMVIRIRQLDSDGNPIEWDSSGCAVVLDDELISSALGGAGWEVVAEADEWITASRDISSLGTNILEYVRFDPVGQFAGTNKTFEVDFVELTSIETPSIPAPPQASNWEFNTDGNLEGWRASANGHIAEVSVSNGVLFSSAIVDTDPQLIGPAVSVGSYYWTTMDVRVRQLDDTGTPVEWNESGCSVVINGIGLDALGSSGWDTVYEPGEWIVTTLDISSFGSSDINSIRIDPVGGSTATGKNFEIDYIRMNNQAIPLPPEADWQFNTDGDQEGWTQAANNHIEGLSVSNGVLFSQAVTGNDPQLIKSGLIASRDYYWTTAEMRVRHLDLGGTPVPFNLAGLTAVIGGKVIQGGKWGVSPDGDEWVVVTVDLTSFGNSNINGIRLDPLGNVINEKNFEVDYIRLNYSLAPLVSTLEYSWEFNTLGDTEGLAGNAGISGLTVADAYAGPERVLTCADITSNDPNINSPSAMGISAGGGAWDKMVVRARQLSGNGGPFQDWVASGTIILVNGANLGIIPGDNTTIISESNGWITATCDISSLEAQNFNNFRLDVVGNSDTKNFEIDWIRLYTKQPPVGYSAWTYAYGLLGGAAALSADPDGDTYNNFYEYAFGGSPTDPLDIGLLPYGRTVQDGESAVLEYIYFKRADPEAEIVYSLDARTDLKFGSWNDLVETVDYTVAGSASFNFEMDAVTNHIPVDVDIKFIRTVAE